MDWLCNRKSSSNDQSINPAPRDGTDGDSATVSEDLRSNQTVVTYCPIPTNSRGMLVDDKKISAGENSAHGPDDGDSRARATAEAGDVAMRPVRGNERLPSRTSTTLSISTAPLPSTGSLPMNV